MLYVLCFHFPILSDTNKSTDSKLHNFYKVIVFLHPEDIKIAFFVLNTDENVYFVLGFGLVFKSIQLHNS